LNHVVHRASVRALTYHPRIEIAPVFGFRPLLMIHFSSGNFT
jgi:hypothetical protein